MICPTSVPKIANLQLKIFAEFFPSFSRLVLLYFRSYLSRVHQVELQVRNSQGFCLLCISVLFDIFDGFSLFLGFLNFLKFSLNSHFLAQLKLASVLKEFFKLHFVQLGLLHVDCEVAMLLNASFLELLHLLQQVLPLMRFCLLKGFRAEIWTRHVLLLWFRTISRLFLEVI